MGTAESRQKKVDKDWRGTAGPWSGEYETMVNGGISFRVRLHDHAVTVDRWTGDDSDDNDVGRVKRPRQKFVKLLTVRPKRVFVGHSPLNAMTKFSGGHGPKFLGNSILLGFEDNVYVFVGDRIASFRTPPGRSIAWFVSPVGNSGVPYPYAVDDKGAMYLVPEGAMILAKVAKKEQILLDDPYDYYYDHSLITRDEGDRKDPPIKAFLGISEYYHGERKYTLRYTPDPETDYDRLQKRFKGRGEMYVIVHGEKARLNKRSYVSLMKRFGEASGFMRIPHLKVHIERDPDSREQDKAGVRQLFAEIGERG